MKNVGAIILAAGLSSRMKENKLLLPLAGKPIIVRTVERFLASQADRTMVVIGNDREKIIQALAAYPVEFIENKDYLHGMSASVKAGIRYASDQLLDGAMICPGDMPFVQTETIDQVLAAFEQTDGIVVPVDQGRRGHPVLFSRSFFPEILGIAGDVGARYLLEHHPEAIRFLPVTDPGMHLDIDNQEVYQSLSGARLEKLLKGREQ